jgi:Ferritin-like domain
MNDTPTHGETRRELIRRGIAVGGLAAASLGIAPALGAAAAATPGPTDGDVLQKTLEVERLLVFCYQHVLRVGALSPRAALVVRQFLAHEQAHVGALASDLAPLGGARVAGPADDATADDALAGAHVSGTLGGLRTERDCIELLLSLEAVAEAAYFSAVSKLHDHGLLQTAAEIFANEAQHAATLSELLHPGDVSRAVPTGFVRGGH